MARRVELSDDEVYGDGTLVEQTEVDWADDEITVTIVKGALAIGPLFLFVTDADEATSEGFPVTLDPQIPVVNDISPTQFRNGDIVEITGSKFKANQGNGKVELGDNHQHNLANKVQQNIDHWEDLAIRFITNKGSLPNGQVWVFVTNDDDETNVPPDPEDPPEPGDPPVTELIPDISVGGLSGGSVEVRLERIYAALAGHTAPQGGRDTHFLMSRIGGELGVNITSGTRSFETNMALMYRAITGNNWTGAKSVELILRAIEAEL